VDLHWQRTGPPNPRFDAMALNRIVSVVNFGALLHWHWPPKWKCVTNLAARQAASASTILQPRSHPNPPLPRQSVAISIKQLQTKGCPEEGGSHSGLE